MEGNMRGEGTSSPRDLDWREQVPSKTLHTQLRAASLDPNPTATLGAVLGHDLQGNSPGGHTGHIATSTKRGQRREQGCTDAPGIAWSEQTT